MTEIDVLKRAKLYIDKMANGRNPITDEEAEENDVINNVRVSRCLFYVSGVLDKVIANGGEVGTKIAKKLPFHIDAEKLKEFDYSRDPIALSEIARRINNLIDNSEMKGISYGKLADLLISNGYLEKYSTDYEKNRKRPTSLGLDIGISCDSRFRADGNVYEVLVYNLNAQKRVIELFAQTM